MNIKTKLRSTIIENAFAKKLLSKRHVSKICSHFMSEAEIEQGEREYARRRILADECIKKSPGSFSNDLKTIDTIINTLEVDSSLERKQKLETELRFFRTAYGFHPEEYLCYELESKSLSECKEFLSSKECITCVYRMNDYSEMQIFNNKGKTYSSFQEYFKRDAVYIQEQKDIEHYLEFVEKHPVFVKKAVHEAMGRSVELIDLSCRSETAEELFYYLLKKGPHLLEERVIQSAHTAQLNASSVNTIRSITFNTRHGIEDPYYFMKVGRAGSFIDNGGAGGILVGIDKETGRLNTDGFDEYNRRYVAHPDSGVVFKGHQLPEWEKLKSLCIELSSQIPKVKFIGWDLAHTDQGWIVIEGNGRSQMIGPQTVFKRGMKKDVEEFMSDMDLVF